MPPKERVLTGEEIKQVEKLAPYLTQEQLADFLGMSKRTFNNIRDRQPEVNATYKMARAEIVGKVAESLVQDALDGCTTSRIFFLKTQAGWRETQQVDHTSSDGTMSPKDGGSALDRINSRLDSLIASKSEGSDPKGAE